MRGAGIPLQAGVSTVSLPGGIRVRIVLVLVGIVAGALGTAYMIVVPSLERRLVDARLDQLERSRPPLARSLSEDRLLWQERVEGFAVVTNARVVALDVLSRNRPALVSLADSQTRDSWDVADDPIALAALVSGEVERGRVVAGGRRLRGRRRAARRRGGRALPGAARGLARDRVGSSGSDFCSRPRSRSCSRSSSGSPRRECSRTACCASRPPPSESRAETSARRSSITATTRSASSRARSTHARPARAARQRPEGVRRERVARAADAALLDRRVPRAARRRGARRGDPPRVHRDDAGAGAAPREAVDRSPRSLAGRRRPARRRS